MKSSPRILSIQSHVVSGYCGNKSATFPLQLLEFEVDIINTVQLSNHTGYSVAEGQIFKSEDLETIRAGLSSNNLLNYDYIVSGYVADVSYIKSMANLIQDIKERRKTKQLDCLYTFDPVLGDEGPGFYVPDGLKVAEAYKQYLIPQADIITPNRFETSVLTGVDIDTTSKDAISQAMEAIQVFHKMGVRTVVITSLALESDPLRLICIISNQSTNTSESNQTFMIRVPRLPCAFTGTGDLFAALFTGWIHKTNHDLKRSLEYTLNTLQEILEDTMEYYIQGGGNTVLGRELRIVQNQKSILSPKLKYKAEKVPI